MTGSIISHVSVGVTDLARAKKFYDAVLGALGYGVVMEEPPYGIAYGTEFPEFWIGPAHNGDAITPGNGVHIAFLAPNKDAIDAFHKAGLKNGGTSDGAPGFRPYTPTYYAAFLRDPDGNKIEAMTM